MFTLDDLRTHLIVQIGTPAAGYDEQKVRTCCMNAWSRLFTAKTDWKWFYRTGRLQVRAAQSAGTITFDYATRVMTLSDATWPADVSSMHVKIDTAWYPVYRRLTDTTVSLHPDNHPRQDLPAGTTYNVQQIIYPLPAEVGPVLQVINPRHPLHMMQLDIAEVMEISDTFGSLTQPSTYALVNDPSHPGVWCLWIPSLLTQDEALHYLYVQRRPDRLVFREDRGTVSIAGGVATFSDPICSPHMMGCVLRVSQTDDAPTGNYGGISSVDVEMNSMAVIETKFTEYLTSTTMRVADLTSSISGAPFVASNHLDVRPGSMEVLLQRLAEDAYGVRPVANHMEGLTSDRRVRMAIAEAATDDSSFRSRSSYLPHWYRLRLNDLVRGVS